MSTVVVWVLLAKFHVFNGGGPIILDNIASEANCRAVARILLTEQPYSQPICFPVRKVRP